MSFTASYHGQMQHHQHSGTSEYQSTTLDPSVTSFYPIGDEMQRYHAPTFLLTPPNSVSPKPSDIVQMRDLVLQEHFAHIKDISSIEVKTQQNAKQLKAVQEGVTSDLQAMHLQIEGLKEELRTRKEQQSLIVKPSIDDADFTPPADLMEKSSAKAVAEAYLEEAESCERTARKLREQAEKLCVGSAKHYGEFHPLPWQSPDMAQIASKSDFVCCGINQHTVAALIEHVGRTHITIREDRKSQTGVSQQNLAFSNTINEGTPTHMPPPRPGRMGKAMMKPYSCQNEASCDAPQKTTTQLQTACMPATEVKDSPEMGWEVRDAKDNETKSNDVNAFHWQPHYVRAMPPASELPPQELEGFTFDFLKTSWGGEEWSPGFHYIANSAARLRSYWLLEDDFEPFLPSAPGLHGAKLTVFFNNTLCSPGAGPEEHHYMDVPVFICKRSEGETRAVEYVYYGHYSQTRFSDRLDVDRMLESISEDVRQYHAEQLADVGRPQWVTEELIKHFWPMPEYSGAIPTDSAVNTPQTEAPTNLDIGITMEAHVMRDLVKYAIELKEWKKDAFIRINLLTAENVMKAFTEPDEGEVPGLRLKLEYLQFERFDKGFYELMKRAKHDRNAYIDNIPTAKQKIEERTSAIKPTSAANAVRTLGSTTIRPKENGFAKTSKDDGIRPPHMRSHMNAIKPWESVKVRDAKRLAGAPAELAAGAAKTELAATGYNRLQVETAEALRNGFKKHSGVGKGEGEKSECLPPHLRSKQAV